MPYHCWSVPTSVNQINHTLLLVTIPLFLPITKHPRTHLAVPLSARGTFPGIHGAPLSLAVRRQVLSTARAYLSEKREERTPGDRLGFSRWARNVGPQTNDGG